FSPPFKGGVARSAGVVALVVSLSALAQYPSKPIRLVVTFPPGGITDFTARALSSRLSEALGQPVIVENKTGSGGNIGTDFVAKSAPDGHTLLIAAPPNAINVSLYRSLPFDTKKDLAPVSLVGSGANVLVVSAKTPVASVRELLEHARRNPGKLNFASNGNGTSITSRASCSSTTESSTRCTFPSAGRPRRWPHSSRATWISCSMRCRSRRRRSRRAR